MTIAKARTIKGGVLSSRLAFLESRGGREAVERVLQRLPPEDVALLRGVIAPAGWYSFDTGSRLDAAIAEELGGGEALFLQMGAQSAQDNLSHAQRAFVREKDPLGLLKGAASIYRLYYKSGHRTFERAGQRKVILRTYDSETFSRADCLTVVGWHERVIGMCGGKNARVEETRCRARGDDVCEYVCEWD
jgi:uncharacterized protein (TIGR02265 family)